MRLTKIQKFLKEHNINYTITINKYGSNESADININDDKTNFKTISEVTGNRGNTVNAILLFYKNKKTNTSYSVAFTSQNEIIKRLKDDITRLREEIY